VISLAKKSLDQLLKEHKKLKREISRLESKLAKVNREIIRRKF